MRHKIGIYYKLVLQIVILLRASYLAFGSLVALLQLLAAGQHSQGIVILADVFRCLDVFLRQGRQELLHHVLIVVSRAAGVAYSHFSQKMYGGSGQTLQDLLALAVDSN